MTLQPALVLRKAFRVRELAWVTLVGYATV